MRFYVGQKDYTARGLKQNAKIIGSWCDNYDLQVNTPNGQRETHAMAIEWRQQDCDGEDSTLESQSLIIPRLTKEEEIIIIRLTCQFHLKWVARLLCLF